MSPIWGQTVIPFWQQLLRGNCDCGDAGRAEGEKSLTQQAQARLRPTAPGDRSEDGNVQQRARSFDGGESSVPVFLTPGTPCSEEPSKGDG